MILMNDSIKQQPFNGLKFKIFVFLEPDIDDCKTNACQNGATCTDSLADYNCSCSLGYAGKNCNVGNNYMI